MERAKGRIHCVILRYFPLCRRLQHLLKGKALLKTGGDGDDDGEDDDDGDEGQAVGAGLVCGAAACTISSRYRESAG